MRYKHLQLLLPASVEIPTCDGCGSEWMDDDVAASIDAALEPVYRAQLRAMAKSAIRSLSELVNQSELERKLGMAQGYLSKLKNGKRDPSPEIVLQLSMIALHPRPRLKEIDDIWNRNAS